MVRAVRVTFLSSWAYAIHLGLQGSQLREIHKNKPPILEGEFLAISGQTKGSKDVF